MRLPPGLLLRQERCRSARASSRPLPRIVLETRAEQVIATDGSRSALTATNNSLAPTRMPAACGCKMGNSSHRSWTASPLAPPKTGRMPKARIKGKLPIEIVVKADERHHTSVRKPRTHAYRRASEAPVSARAVAVNPTGAQHHLSPRVPLHPVWQTPVARLSVRIRPASSKPRPSDDGRPLSSLNAGGGNQLQPHASTALRGTVSGLTKMLA